MQTIYLELKATVKDLLPYALLVWLGWLLLQQQERLVDERLDVLRADVREQTVVLSAIRDQLRTSGLVVPPFPTSEFVDD